MYALLLTPSYALCLHIYARYLSLQFHNNRDIRGNIDITPDYTVLISCFWNELSAFWVKFRLLQMLYYTISRKNMYKICFDEFLPCHNHEINIRTTLFMVNWVFTVFGYLPLSVRVFLLFVLDNFLHSSLKYLITAPICYLISNIRFHDMGKHVIIEYQLLLAVNLNYLQFRKIRFLK